MSTYLNKVRKFNSKFTKFLIEQLLNTKNSNVDALVNLGSSTNLEFKRTILVEILAHLNILDLEKACNAKTVDLT